MLNPFPIQFLSLFAYFILRVVIGLFFLILGHCHFKQRDSLSSALTLKIFPFGKIITLILILTEIIIGFLFILGLYTQIAALITLIMSFKMMLFRNKFNHPALPTRLTYLLLFAISFSLFITGAGVFAFDLPI